MYQRLVLVGNLGRDPEMRYTPNGTAVTSLSVATSRKYTTADGQQKEETVWFRVSVWGKQAEPCNQYISAKDARYWSRVRWCQMKTEAAASGRTRKASRARHLKSARTPSASWTASAMARRGLRVEHRRPALEDQPTTGEELPFKKTGSLVLSGVDPGKIAAHRRMV